MPEIANDTPPPAGTIAQQQASAIALSMLNASMHAQVGLALGGMKVNATDVMNLLVEHLANVLSLVEPDQLRNTILGEIRRNLPEVLNRHVLARKTTAGGIFVPGPGTRVQ